MDLDVEPFRARAKEARESYEKVLRERETEPPSASPTTFSDCASLHEQSALAYRVASALGSGGHFAQAAGYAAQGASLADSAASCDVSASGGTIEV